MKSRSGSLKFRAREFAFPPHYTVGKLSPGPHVLTARIQKNEERRWTLALYFSHQAQTTILPEKATVWLEREQRNYSAGGPEGVAHELGATVDLLRLRAHDVTESRADGRLITRPPDGPSQGVMIWLRPVAE